MSGHCRFPETPQPTRSHERCQRLGHGNTANPEKEFSPCPCHCHLGADEFECANCGGSLREAPFWPNEDEPGEMVYVHVDSDGNATGEECEHLRKAVEPEPEEEPEAFEVLAELEMEFEEDDIEDDDATVDEDEIEEDEDLFDDLDEEDW
jgi:hypothetical protein